jgi:hypothetical protein
VRGTLLALAAAGGAVLRLLHYVDRRSLWLDECMLALNIVTRGFLDLLRPMDYNQAAAPLFLWAEHLAVLVGGVGELSLRAVPMAAGLLLPVLVGLLGFRLGGTAMGASAAALAALSPILIRFANEAKPYGVDPFVSAVLLVLAWAVLRRPDSRGRFWALGTAGLLGLLVSIPAVFTLGAVAAGLWLHRGAPVPRLRIVACGALWGLATAVLFFTYYRTPHANPGLHAGYEKALLVPGRELGERLALALPGTVLPVVTGDGANVPRALAPVHWALVAAYLLGAAWLGRRHGVSGVVLIAGPLLLCCAASAVRVYPVGVPRLMAFVAPSLILLLAAAAAAVAEALAPHARPAVLAAAGVTAVAFLAVPRARAALHPWRGEEAARLVEAFRHRPREVEPVYVGAAGIPSWIFYTTNWEKPNRDRLAFYAQSATAGPSFNNNPPRAFPVVDEGADNVYRFRDRREILGLGPGNQWRWPTFVKRVPDAGWADNEAGRIAREANPCAWLYFTHVSDNSARSILWVLRDDYKAKREFQMYVSGGALFRYCFPLQEYQLGRGQKVPR